MILTLNVIQINADVDTIDTIFFVKYKSREFFKFDSVSRCYCIPSVSLTPRY